MDIELKDFELAQERLRPILHHTELDLSSTFSVPLPKAISITSPTLT